MQPVPHVSPKVKLLVMYTPAAWQDFGMTEDALLAKFSVAYPLVDLTMFHSHIHLEFEIKVVKVSAGVEDARTHRTSWCGVYAWRQRCPISWRSCDKTAEDMNDIFQPRFETSRRMMRAREIGEEKYSRPATS